MDGKTHIVVHPDGRVEADGRILLPSFEESKTEGRKKSLRSFLGFEPKKQYSLEERSRLCDTFNMLIPLGVRLRVIGRLLQDEYEVSDEIIQGWEKEIDTRREMEDLRQRLREAEARLAQLHTNPGVLEVPDPAPQPQQQGELCELAAKIAEFLKDGPKWAAELVDHVGLSAKQIGGQLMRLPIAHERLQTRGTLTMGRMYSYYRLMGDHRKPEHPHPAIIQKVALTPEPEPTPEPAGPSVSTTPEVEPTVSAEEAEVYIDQLKLDRLASEGVYPGSVKFFRSNRVREGLASNGGKWNDPKASRPFLCLYVTTASSVWTPMTTQILPNGKFIPVSEKIGEHAWTRCASTCFKYGDFLILDNESAVFHCRVDVTEGNCVTPYGLRTAREIIYRHRKDWTSEVADLMKNEFRVIS